MNEELTTVRRNLLNVPDYSPYCGAERCSRENPRASWDPSSKQFICLCGWSSNFEAEFIEQYEKRRLVLAGCWHIIQDFSNSDPHRCRKPCVGETLYCDQHQIAPKSIHQGQ